MVGNQAFNNCSEIVSPAIRKCIQRHTSTAPQEKASMSWEMDNKLEDMPILGLFYEYLNMVIQVGGHLSYDRRVRQQQDITIFTLTYEMSSPFTQALSAHCRMFPYTRCFHRCVYLASLVQSAPALLIISAHHHLVGLPFALFHFLSCHSVVLVVHMLSNILAVTCPSPLCFHNICYYISYFLSFL